MGNVRRWIDDRCVVRKGSNRVVIDFVNHGFVVKFPIVHFILLAREVKTILYESRICAELFYSLTRLFTLSTDLTDVVGAKMLLFKGIADNWREFWFCLVDRHPFAHPTYFSLFGLMNVQKKGDPVNMERGDFGWQMRHIIGEEKFYSDGHHFSVPGNFCLFNGKLRMVDYGSPKTRKIIREVGMCVHKNFKVC